MVHDNQAKLADKLKELFNITNNQKGISGVYRHNDTYSSVVLECSNYLFTEMDMQKLFEAKEYAQAGGFSMPARMERESKARHYILFHF